MGIEVKSQGIGPVLLEVGVINVFGLHIFYYLVAFCLGPCSHLVQLVRGTAQGHRLTQLLVDNFSPS